MAPQELEEESYHVEVSGWDMGENFFVEKTTLVWHKDGSKRAVLRARIHTGSLVFVRLANETCSGRSIPVTYQVARIDSDFSGQGREIELTQLHARQPQPQEAAIGVPHDVTKN